MYEAHYNLTEKPFTVSPDPRFLWLGEKHKEALAFLKYGILNNVGLLLLTGDVGTGKTTLANALVNGLEDDVFVATISDPKLERLEFFNYLAHSLNINRKFDNKGDFILAFTKYLHFQYENGKKTLLIIDEAQSIPFELLEEIRLISNIERTDTKLLNIFFVGQSEFNTLLLKHELRALRQRIVTWHNIDPLTNDETKQYVEHRLKIAGGRREIFTQEAIHGIYSFSKGYPRKINVICDYALLSGYASDLQRINARVINECSKELSLPGEEKLSEVDRPKPKQVEKIIPFNRKAIYLILILIILGAILASPLQSNLSSIIGKYQYRQYVRSKIPIPKSISSQTVVPQSEPNTAIGASSQRAVEN